MSAIVHLILQWLQTAGLPVLFLLMALEMAMLLHGLPTELVMAAATVTLAKTGWDLVLIVAVATAGSSAGAMLPWAAGYYGGRPFLERHQRFFHLSPQRLERLEEWFRRPAGPILVATIRLAPLVRSFPAIPAGLARMPWRPYLLLTTLGCLVFNTVIVYATYASGHPGLPLGDELAAARAALGTELLKLQAYWTARWWLAALAVLAVLALLLRAWRRREAIRRRPIGTFLHALRVASWTVAGLGALLLLGALVAPDGTFSVVAWLALDYANWASTSGLGAAVLVLIVASEVLSVAIVGFALLPLFRRARHQFEHKEPPPEGKP